jgi:hypothetical protein
MNNEENYMAQVNDDQFVENIATSNIVNLNTNTFNWQKFTAPHTGTLRYVDLYFDSSVTYRPSSTLKICNGLCTFNNSNALFLQNVSIKGGVSVQRFKLGNVSVLAGTQYVIELSDNNQWLSANSFSDANTDPSNFTTTNPGNKRLMKIYYGGYKNFKLGYDGNMHIGPPTGHNYKLNVNGTTYTGNLEITDLLDDKAMVANAQSTISAEDINTKWNINKLQLTTLI